MSDRSLARLVTHASRGHQEGSGELFLEKSVGGMIGKHNADRLFARSVVHTRKSTISLLKAEARDSNPLGSANYPNKINIILLLTEIERWAYKSLT